MVNLYDKSAPKKILKFGTNTNTENPETNCLVSPKGGKEGSNILNVKLKTILQKEATCVCNISGYVKSF